MEKLIQSLDYIRGLFNQHKVVNGQYAGRKNTIEVDDDLRKFIDNTLIPTMAVLNQQEQKDAVFEGALECIQHLAKVVNDQTDNLVVVNTKSVRDGYYGS